MPRRDADTLGPLFFPEPLRPARQRLLELLRDRAYERRAVVLASGRASDFYIDCRRVVLTAEGHALVGPLLAYATRILAPQAVAIGGMSLGADPLVSAASFASFGGPQPLDGFYVRKEAKGHGTGQFLEGAAHLPAGAPVVIVEDVVTSGGSALRALERAKQAGLCPVHVVALVDREEGGREQICAHGPLSVLYPASEIKGR